MAGIGFKLKELFDNKSISDKLKGSFYSIIISSGSWLVTVIALFILSIHANSTLQIKDLIIFKTIITYVFAFSLILYGLFELPFTRYIADKIYLNDKNDLITAMNVILFIEIIIGGSGSIIFFYMNTFPKEIIITSATLFVANTIICTSMSVLSAAKNYSRIVFAFVIGFIIISFLPIIARIIGLTSSFNCLFAYLFTFTLGEVLIAILLTLRIYIEFNPKIQNYPLSQIVYELINYFLKHSSLIFIGFIYYFALWIDKFIFWFSSLGTNVHGYLYMNRFYDSSMFMAYISIVPAIAVFMVKSETDFFVKYRHYYKTIEARKNLHEIEKARIKIADSVFKQISLILKIQTPLTVLLLFTAEKVIFYLNFNESMIPVFRYGLFGAYFQAFFMMINIMLIYFSDYKSILQNYFLFLFLNFALTLISTKFNPDLYGSGYMIASFLTLLLSIYKLQLRIKTLNYYTFAMQPIPKTTLIDL